MRFAETVCLLLVLLIGAQAGDFDLQGRIALRLFTFTCLLPDGLPGIELVLATSMQTATLMHCLQCCLTFGVCQRSMHCRPSRIRRLCMCRCNMLARDTPACLRA